MGKQATFYHVSDTPVGALFRGDGNRIKKDQLAVTYSLESYRRPDTADSSERIVGRWHSTEMDIVGKFGGNNRGSVAVGQGYLLLTERFLRGTVTGSGSKNRILVPDKNSYRLKAFSGTYAFLFDLVTDVTEFNGHSKAVAISGQDSGLLVADPYTADEKWKSKMFALPGRRTIEFGEILLDTIIRAKMVYGDEQTSRAARNVADSDWRNKIASSGRTPYIVKFLPRHPWNFFRSASGRCTGHRRISSQALDGPGFSPQPSAPPPPACRSAESGVWSVPTTG